MVCVPCIVIPLLLWVFHKYIQPWILKFWNPKSDSLTASGSAEIPPEVYETTEGKFIKEKITSNPVMMFSKTTCNFCNMAKKVLDEVGVNYEVEELNKREDCSVIQDKLLQITGVRTVPRVFVGEKCIGGGSETFTLHNQGKLIPMMKQAGATFKKDL